ncbi:hypothetical protein ABFU82_21870 [Nocardioides sp. WV_118_6]
MTLGSLLVRPWLPPTWAAGIVVAVVLYGLLHDTVLPRLPLPQNARQVPENVVRSGPRLGALQFGLEMGTGARTFMTSMTPHMLGATLLLLMSWQAGLLAGAAFGLGRSIVPLARSLTEHETRWSNEFADRERTIRTAIAATSAAAWITLMTGTGPW